MSVAIAEKPSYELSSWDLSELLPEPTEAILSERLADLEKKVQDFVAVRENLNPEMDPEMLLNIMGQYEDLVETIFKLGAYGSLWFSADTQSSAALTYRNRLQQVSTDVQNRTLFFDLWWKGLDDDEASALLPNSAHFPDQRHYLADLRRTKPYTLDEKSEQLINTKDANGIDAVMT
ncbi:MAG: oligoendopeptidase F, partial [Caldilineaceae bacterium]|nr:oligoendopeptidase F [Caldilineaceae bacterium]